MELNVTKQTLPFYNELLKSSVAFCKALSKEIKLVEKQGATSPEKVKSSSKKAAKKAAKKEATPAKEEKTAKKVGKKAAKKAAAKKVAKKSSEETSSTGRVTLKMRVQKYLGDNHTSKDVWTPKDLLSSKDLDGTGNVPLNQVLNQLIEAGEIEKVSRGKYKLM